MSKISHVAKISNRDAIFSGFDFFFTVIKISYAYKTALGRAPRAAETSYLKRLILKRLTYFEINPKEAANLIANTKGWKMPKAMDKGELATWFFIANILLNLDETITKG